jgi:hypothetical protein
MLLQKIKEHYHKQEHQFITVQEFCHYTGIKTEDAIQYLAA